MSSAPPPAAPRGALSFLLGARVQRVDGPSPTLFAVTLYDRGQKESLILALAPRRVGLGLVAQRPSGQAASAFVRRLRVALENARLVEAHWLGGQSAERASALELHFLRGAESARLAVDFDEAHPNLFLLAADGTILGAADEGTRRARFPGPKPLFLPTERGEVGIVATREDALLRGSALLAHQARSVDLDVRAQAAAHAKAALKRLSRKAEAIREDVARAESAPLLRRDANLLLCHLPTIPAGASEVQLEDIASDPPEIRTVRLDPSLSAQANAERQFARARRMERGAGIARQRLAQTEAEITAFTGFAQRVAELDAASLIHEAEALGIKLDAAAITSRTGGVRKPRQAHVPYRVFHGSGGARILVGKGAADNDALTLTVARPHDLWLHARGLQGAHVIVACERAQAVSAELLIDAAHLAAHFSSARGEPSAEIQYAERRHLRKPKGSAPGAVRVDRERVLLLRIQPERLRRLLASERAP